MVSMGLTHLDKTGRPTMVDVGEKPETARQAVAAGERAQKVGPIRTIASRTLLYSFVSVICPGPSAFANRP